jgi:hypothetical protein
VCICLWACLISVSCTDVTTRPSIPHPDVIASKAASRFLVGSLKNLIAPPGLKSVTYAPTQSGWSTQDTMATDTNSGGTGQRRAPAPRPALLGSPNRALFIDTLPGHINYVEER